MQEHNQGRAETLTVKELTVLVGALGDMMNPSVARAPTRCGGSLIA